MYVDLYGVFHSVALLCVPARVYGQSTMKVRLF